MKLNSKTVTVQKSAAELCDFLTDVRNFEGLMPEDTTKFEILNDKSFVFALKGMPDIALEIKEVEKPNKVVLGANNDKIPFSLTGNIQSVSENSATVELLFDGKLNAMMAMMAKGPISKFIDTIATNLEQV